MYDESRHIQVEGHAVAESGGAGTIATVQWLPEFSNSTFQVVPTGRKLILTDILYNPQRDVNAPHTINVAEMNPEGSRRIIIQFIVPPGATQQVHFHTGYVIEPGKKVVVYTDANPPAGQHFSIALNGHLARARRG
ncbi:MAG: hypothetical protein PVI59_11380 [Anaerolineae bacterium]|jgi:hypothetical protein